MEGILIVINCIRLTLGVQNDSSRKPRCGVNLNLHPFWFGAYIFPPASVSLGLLFKFGEGGRVRHTHKFGQSLAGEWGKKEKVSCGCVIHISHCKSLGFRVQANPRGKGRGGGLLSLLLFRNLIPAEEFLRSTAHDSGDNDSTLITFCLFAPFTKYFFKVVTAPGQGGRGCCRPLLLGAQAQGGTPAPRCHPHLGEAQAAERKAQTAQLAGAGRREARGAGHSLYSIPGPRSGTANSSRVSARNRGTLRLSRLRRPNLYGEGR